MKDTEAFCFVLDEILGLYTIFSEYKNENGVLIVEYLNKILGKLYKLSLNDLEYVAKHFGDEDQNYGFFFPQFIRAMSWVYVKKDIGSITLSPFQTQKKFQPSVVIYLYNFFFEIRDIETGLIPLSAYFRFIKSIDEKIDSNQIKDLMKKIGVLDFPGLMKTFDFLPDLDVGKYIISCDQKIVMEQIKIVDSTFFNPRNENEILTTVAIEKEKEKEKGKEKESLKITGKVDGNCQNIVYKVSPFKAFKNSHQRKEMVVVETNEIINIQKKTNQIRNVCILAHVDHGKTTLSDSLVASNGIISQRLAGKIRYLDFRDDEQERQITMKSSAISLLYRHNKPEEEEETILINMIDSPGHVDFSGEVSAAVRITDGALILVDAIEGVCVQTQMVMRQAYEEGLESVIVINKLDRLIVELLLSPLEAYNHLHKVLEQVNVVAARLCYETCMASEIFDYENEIFYKDESYYSPERGNVIFSSSVDGWAFGINHFSKIYAGKLNVNEKKLSKYLWGNYYLDPKKKRISKKKPTPTSKSYNPSPMFAQLILKNIWDIYDAINSKNQIFVNKIIKTLDLENKNENLYDLEKNNPKSIIKNIFSQWLPLHEAVLGVIADVLPSPITAQETRLKLLWSPSSPPPPPPLTNHNNNSSNNEIFESVGKKQKIIESEWKKCNSNCEECVIFISKILSLGNYRAKKQRYVPRYIMKKNENEHKNISHLSVEEDDENEEEDDEKGIVAIGRIFCGTIKKGQKVYILNHGHNPYSPYPERSTSEVIVKDLYLMMGSHTENLNEIPAGNILGIGGLSKFIPKSGTISSTIQCSPIKNMRFTTYPIVRVAVEPVRPDDLPLLLEGLKLLGKADPIAQTIAQESGEHVIAASGELHLQRCLKDLKDIYARGVDFKASEPLVPFRETLISPTKLKFHPKKLKEAFSKLSDNNNSDLELAGKKLGLAETWTANKLVRLWVRAVSLPEKIIEYLQNHSNELINMSSMKRYDGVHNQKIIMGLKEAFDQCGNKWSEESKKIWSVGPRKTGTNILINHSSHFPTKKSIGDFISSEIVKEKHIDEDHNDDEDGDVDDDEDDDEDDMDETFLINYESLENSFVAGFQLATNSGPLCEESMHGICFIVENVTFFHKTKSDFSDTTYGPLSGQIISSVKESIRNSFLAGSPRLMEPYFKCDVLATTDFLGKVYSVLRKRRAKILNEEMKEGLDIFSIQAKLPVAESFGFYEEILKRASGGATSQLIFDGFETMSQDPFFIPTTTEELEEFGKNMGAIPPNIARVYISNVRKRKGLLLEEKIVNSAEKQRTLSKKK